MEPDFSLFEIMEMDLASPDINQAAFMESEHKPEPSWSIRYFYLNNFFEESLTPILIPLYHDSPYIW